ncbi:putative sodium/potassium/calcium exchanger [Cryobacterium tepidiphilum]|uniref:hypothetical protein n=1 Tax=Cryobacterium tepidiphilum TaxID=2486026 RepID=UPI0013141C84|nr:hypothetical protein [Cryobacterium tepidiphilum]
MQKASRCRHWPRQRDDCRDHRDARPYREAIVGPGDDARENHGHMRPGDQRQAHAKRGSSDARDENERSARDHRQPERDHDLSPGQEAGGADEREPRQRRQPNGERGGPFRAVRLRDVAVQGHDGKRSKADGTCDEAEHDREHAVGLDHGRNGIGAAEGAEHLQGAYQERDEDRREDADHSHSERAAREPMPRDRRRDRDQRSEHDESHSARDSADGEVPALGAMRSQVEGKWQRDKGGDAGGSGDEAPEGASEVPAREPGKHRDSRKDRADSEPVCRGAASLDESCLREHDCDGGDLHHRQGHLFHPEASVESPRRCAGKSHERESDEGRAEVPDGRRDHGGARVADHRGHHGEAEQRYPEPGSDARESGQCNHGRAAGERSDRRERPRAKTVRSEFGERVHVEGDEHHPECADHLGRELQPAPGEQPSAAQEQEGDNADDCATKHSIAELRIEECEDDRRDGEQPSTRDRQHRLHRGA